MGAGGAARFDAARGGRAWLGFRLREAAAAFPAGASSDADAGSVASAGALVWMSGLTGGGSRRLNRACFGNDRVRDDRGRRARSHTGVVAGAQDRGKRDDEANGRRDGGRTGQRTRSTEGNALRQTSDDRAPLSHQPANRTIRVPLVTGTMPGLDVVCALTTQKVSVRRCAVLDEFRSQPIGDMPHADLRCPSPRGGEKGQAGDREQ